MDDTGGGENEHLAQSETGFVSAERQDRNKNYGLATFVSTLRLSRAFLFFFFVLTRFALNRSR